MLPSFLVTSKSLPPFALATPLDCSQLLVADPSAGWGHDVLNPPAPPPGGAGGATPLPARDPAGLHAVDAVRVERETWLGRILSLGPQSHDFVLQPSGV